MTRRYEILPAPPGWRAGTVNTADPNKDRLQDVIGWLVQITLPTDPFGEEDPDADPTVFATPIVDQGDGCAVSQSCDYTLPPGVDPED